MYWTPFRNRLLPALVLVFFCLSAGSANAELSRDYKKWVDEDVRWIITDQERADFLKLSNDKQRDDFVKAFWARRDPTPGTPQNGFKEEHYRRLAYANEHFAAGVPGWKTDRGRVYIVYGPPDTVESHRADVNVAGDAVYPNEVWHYRYIEGMGKDATWEFVDTCRCGDYHLTADPAAKKPAR